MAAATAKELLDTYKESPGVFHSSNINMLLVGCLISFVVSLIVVKAFITYIQHHTFRAFGVYRILAAGVIFLLIYQGVIKNEAPKGQVEKQTVSAVSLTI